MLRHSHISARDVLADAAGVLAGAGEAVDQAVGVVRVERHVLRDARARARPSPGGKSAVGPEDGQHALPLPLLERRGELADVHQQVGVDQQQPGDVLGTLDVAAHPVHRVGVAREHRPRRAGASGTSGWRGSASWVIGHVRFQIVELQISRSHDGRRADGSRRRRNCVGRRVGLADERGRRRHGRRRLPPAPTCPCCRRPGELFTTRMPLRSATRVSPPGMTIDLLAVEDVRPQVDAPAFEAVVVDVAGVLAQLDRPAGR